MYNQIHGLAPHTSTLYARRNETLSAGALPELQNVAVAYASTAHTWRNEAI